MRDGKIISKVPVRQRKTPVAKKKKPPTEPADEGTSPEPGTEDPEDPNDILTWDDGEWFSDTDTSVTPVDGGDQI